MLLLKKEIRVQKFFFHKLPRGKHGSLLIKFTFNNLSLKLINKFLHDNYVMCVCVLMCGWGLGNVIFRNQSLSHSYILTPKHVYNCDSKT